MDNNDTLTESMIDIDDNRTDRTYSVRTVALSEISMAQPQDPMKAIQDDLQKDNFENGQKVIDFHKPVEDKDYTQHFFLFVNPGSGSQKATQILKDIVDTNQDFDIFRNDKINKIKIHFHDISKLESRTNAFEQMKQLMEYQLVYTIVCGGDGSIMWMVQLLSDAQMNFEKTVIGTIPLGTGNDFSRAVGWGPGTHLYKLLRNNYNGLKQLVSKWLTGKVSDFDIWDIQLEVQKDGGYFEKVTKNEKGKPEITKVKNPENPSENLRIFNKTMSNYFSFGIDARIGLGFDLHRTQSRTCNYCMYICEGFKKLFSSTPKINQTLYSLELIHNIYQNARVSNLPTLVQHNTLSKNNSLQKQKLNAAMENSNATLAPENLDDDLNQSFRSSAQTLTLDEVSQIDNQSSISSKPSSKIMFKVPQEELFVTRGRNTLEEDGKIIKQLKKGLEMDEKNKKKLEKKQEKIYMSGKASTFLILNINSYCGGTKGIWDGSKNKMGLVNFNNENKLQKEQTFKNQDFSDGQLEMMQYPSYGKFLCEQMCNGNTRRMAQGTGPFLFNFREKDDKGKLLHNYFQIDGEYFGVHGLKQAKIRPSHKGKNGKIKILVEEFMYNQYRKRNEFEMQIMNSQKNKQ